MSRKIYDIIPPKASQAHRASHSSHGDKTKQSAKVSHQPSKDRFPLMEVIIGGGVIIVLLITFFYSKLPRAQIEIAPKTEELASQAQFIASTSVQAADFSKALIPARYEEIQKIGKEEFPASGFVPQEGKASGTIRIYNKTSPAASITLKAGTHFLSDSGKYFVVLERIVVPAAQGKSPGSIEVKAQAKESGEEYNIEPSQFSVPKLSGTSYYYSIWAESKSPMTGGFSSRSKTVTADDISRAKDILVEKLIEQAKSELKEKISSDDILIDNAIVQEVVSVDSSVKAGAIADAFEEKATVKISAIIFKKKDAQDLAGLIITSDLSETKYFLEDKLELVFLVNNFDISKGKLPVTMKISAQTYEKIDQDDLKNLILGKTSLEIEEILGREYGGKISWTKISFWPFWVVKIPQDRSRTTIKMNFQ